MNPDELGEIDLRQLSPEELTFLEEMKDAVPMSVVMAEIEEILRGRDHGEKT